MASTWSSLIFLIWIACCSDWRKPVTTISLSPESAASAGAAKQAIATALTEPIRMRLRTSMLYLPESARPTGDTALSPFQYHMGLDWRR